MTDGLSEVLRSGDYLVCLRAAAYEWTVGRPHRSFVWSDTGQVPRVFIADDLPAWMSLEDLARKRETPLWLDDDPPQGLLHALMTDRHRS